MVTLSIDGSLREQDTVTLVFRPLMQSAESIKEENILQLLTNEALDMM